jgi:hypothetical protein
VPRLASAAEIPALTLELEMTNEEDAKAWALDILGGLFGTGAPARRALDSMEGNLMGSRSKSPRRSRPRMGTQDHGRAVEW